MSGNVLHEGSRGYRSSRINGTYALVFWISHLYPILPSCPTRCSLSTSSRGESTATEGFSPALSSSFLSHLRQQVMQFTLYSQAFYNLTETLNISGILRRMSAHRLRSLTYKYRINFLPWKRSIFKNRSKHHCDSLILRDQESENYNNGGVTRVVVI
jgi:hypothetical protein